MFTYRTAEFRLAKILALVHIFLTCLSTPLAVSDDDSVTLTTRSGSVRRLPSLSFEVLEGSNNGRIPMETPALSHRRSHDDAVNKDENYILRRVPTYSNRRSHYRQADVKEDHQKNVNKNVNTNVNKGTGFIHENENLPQEIRSSVRKIEGYAVNKKLETKLYGSVVFRTNIIAVFGQMLRASNNKLTEDQYTSLNLILQALIRKQVYMFSILPTLKKLQNSNKNTQFKHVILALANNVPPYLVSACKYLANETDKQRINVEEIFASVKNPADFLTGIDPVVIDTCKVKVAAEELEPFDEDSEVIKTVLGPVFVNIFSKLKNRQMILSQKLFGAILMNLPTGKMNPILEEHIDYTWDLTQENSLPKWSKIAPGVEYGNPYEVVFSVARKYLSEKDIPSTLKRTLQYISLHLKKVPSTFSDEYYPDMQILLNDENVAERLLFMIEDDIEIPEQSGLRDHMIVFIKHMNIENILGGMNKYVYQEPIDLLIAILARIQGRTQDNDVKDTATKLLSILVLRKYLNPLTVTVPSEVDMLTLLDYLKVPENDPAVSILAHDIQVNLEYDFDLLKNLQDLLPKEDKSKCQRPIQCLLRTLEETIPLTVKRAGIPSNMLTMTKKLGKLIKNAINSSAKCKPQDVIAVENQEIPDDLNNLLIGKISQSSEYTGKPTILSPPSSVGSHWSLQPVITTNYDESTDKPDDTDLPSQELIQILYPVNQNDQVEDLHYSTAPIKDVIWPDKWLLKPSVAKVPESKPTLTSTPKPKLTSIAIIKPTLTPQIIEAFRPPVKQPNKPVVEVLIKPSPSPITKKPIAATSNFVPTKKPPTKQPMNPLPSQPESEPILPPNLSYERPIYFIFPEGDAPPYMLSNRPSDKVDNGVVLQFSSIKELLQELNPKKPFRVNELPEIPDVTGPLRETLGPNFIEEILGKRVNKTEYPTVISLIDDVLDQALEHPKVIANPKLALTIQRYLKAIDYLSTTALIPVVIDSKRIPSDVLHVTFDPDNPSENSVHSEPPKQIPPGFMTMPIYHPKYWVQQVDLADPYGTLLPNPEEGENNPIQDVINDGSLQETLGPDFDPLLYPNKGTLLTAILQRLIASERIKSDPSLLKKLYAYLKSIRTVALYSKVPKNYRLELQNSNNVNWQPDTSSLLMALPSAKNKGEAKKINLIKIFLQTPNLLQLLQIQNPSYYTTRGELLKIIFHAALKSDELMLDSKTLAALKYYENKILTTGNGALPLVWVWVQLFIIREEVPLGEIIETVLDYNRLPEELRFPYNDVMIFLSNNPQVLQNNDDFEFEKYRTKGEFLKALFSYFTKKHGIEPKIKKHLKRLMPYVLMTGRGSEPMNHITVDDITNGRIDQNDLSILLNG